MNLEIQHVEIHVSSLERAKEFYVDKLGLEVLEERPSLNLIALKAGGVRISLFGGYEPSRHSSGRKAGTHIIFRTDDLEKTVAVLKRKGVEFRGEIFEVPGFIRDIATIDPDGNVIEIAQYLRDPLQPADH